MTVLQVDNVAALARPKACPAAPSAAALDRQRRLLVLALVLADAAAIVLALLVAYGLRFGLEVALQTDVAPQPLRYAAIGAVQVAALLGLFWAYGLYDRRNLLGGTREYAAAANACTVGVMVLVIVAFLDETLIVSRMWIVYDWLLSVVLVCLARFGVRRCVYHLRSRGLFLAPTLVIGANREARTLVSHLQHWRTSGLRLLGYVATPTPAPDSDAAAMDDGSAAALDDALPVLGDIGDIEALVRRHGAREVLVAITALEREELLDVCERVNAMEGVDLKLSSGLFELLTTGVRVHSLAGMSLMSMDRLRLDPMQRAFKRALDLAVATLALLLLAPLLLTIALAVKCGSRGPVLYRRRVLGVGGRPFDAFKFRTMVVDGDAVLARHAGSRDRLTDEGKLRHDPRITGVGRLLRRYSLDELPQLFNVLRGQMSLVGPRMISPDEGVKYGRHRVNLLTVKPGITGLWQVSGRSDLTYEQRVAIDMQYIRHYSVWLDLQILFIATPPAVLSGRGAY